MSARDWFAIQTSAMGRELPAKAFAAHSRLRRDEQRAQSGQRETQCETDCWEWGVTFLAADGTIALRRRRATRSEETYASEETSWTFGIP